MNFSQNNEQEHILRYFQGKSFSGRFLDIGAYDGVKLSNTYALALLGWEGVSLDPDPGVFKRLEKNVKSLNVKCFNYGIHTESGEIEFYSNQNAVATFDRLEIVRWGSTQKFEKVKAAVKTFEEFHAENPGEYHFINIDAEGLDFDILKAIDLEKVNCMLLCVEHNGKEKDKYKAYMSVKGYSLLLENAENFIFGK